MSAFQSPPSSITWLFTPTRVTLIVFAVVVALTSALTPAVVPAHTAIVAAPDPCAAVIVPDPDEPATAVHPYPLQLEPVAVGDPVSALNVRPVTVGVLNVIPWSSVIPSTRTVSPAAQETLATVSAVVTSVVVEAPANVRATGAYERRCHWYV